MILLIFGTAVDCQVALASKSSIAAGEKGVSRATALDSTGLTLCLCGSHSSAFVWGGAPGRRLVSGRQAAYREATSILL